MAVLKDRPIQLTLPLIGCQVVFLYDAVCYPNRVSGKVMCNGKVVGKTNCYVSANLEWCCKSVYKEAYNRAKTHREGESDEE